MTEIVHSDGNIVHSIDISSKKEYNYEYEEVYYFIKNLQGDVIAIVDKDTQTVARYSYDAWGVPEIKFDSSECQIATINPFRYRSYYFDEEIELYYLQSRYYDADVGRFVNSDEIMMLQIDTNSILKENLYTYCSNNPVVHSDPTGYGLWPVGTPNYFYGTYKKSVSKWADKYAPMSNGVEYGAIIYRVKLLCFTCFFMGETYKGFQTQNWYTVINGLGMGFLISVATRAIARVYYPVINLSIVVFAHTHPVSNSNAPSGPDIWMKRLGWIVSLRIFPIAVYKNKKTAINYF